MQAKFKKSRKIAACKTNTGAHYGEVVKCSRCKLAERVINFPSFFIPSQFKHSPL